MLPAPVAATLYAPRTRSSLFCSGTTVIDGVRVPGHCRLLSGQRRLVRLSFGNCRILPGLGLLDAGWGCIKIALLLSLRTFGTWSDYRSGRQIIGFWRLPQRCGEAGQPEDNTDDDQYPRQPFGDLMFRPTQVAEAPACQQRPFDPFDLFAAFTAKIW